MSVSVVIPTYNRIESLLDVLDALRRQTFRDFEVIVVNGPSTDGTAERLASLDAAIRYVDNPERNLSRSRNQGIEAAAGELVAFLDDDAVPEPRWLEDLVGAFDGDRVGGVGGLVLDHTGVLVQWRHLVVSRTGEHDFDQQPPFDRFVYPGADPFLYVAGGNSAFRRVALAEIDGFDEEIEYNYDEAEACLRLLDAGWELRSLDVAVVHHRNLPSDQRSASAFTDPYVDTKNRVYFGLRSSPDRTAALISANRALGHRRATAREAARHGRLSDAELARYLGRADAGFHAGLRRGSEGERSGRTLGPPDPAGFRPYATLAPPSRRRVALTDPDAARGLAAEGHEAHLLRLAAASQTYRVAFDHGVWVHTVPVGPRWLPALDGSPWRVPLEEAAALRGALAAARGREPIEADVTLSPPLDGFLHGDLSQVQQLIMHIAGLAPQPAADSAARLLADDRFPVDYEAAVRPCLELDDDGFVACVYDVLLGRPVDPYGAHWVETIATHADRIALLQTIASSPEARARGVPPAFAEQMRREARGAEGGVSGRLRHAWRHATGAARAGARRARAGLRR